MKYIDLSGCLREKLLEGTNMLFVAEAVKELVARLNRSAKLPWSEALVNSWMTGMVKPSELEVTLVCGCLNIKGADLGLEDMDFVPTRRTSARTLMEASKRFSETKSSVPKPQREGVFMSGGFAARLRFALIRRGRITAEDSPSHDEFYGHIRFLIGSLVSPSDDWVVEMVPPPEPALTALAVTLDVDAAYLAGEGWSDHSVLNVKK